MKRIAALAAALLLALTLPVAAQTPETPPAGTVVVIAGIYDGVSVVPIPGSIIVPPLACDPS